VDNGEVVPNEPRLLGLDIETAPAIAYVWGMHDQNIGLDQLVQPSRVLCWSAKWFGEKKILYMDERSGARKMLSTLRDLMEESDGVVTYNGSAFDLQKLDGEFIFHRLPPCPPLTHIDLYKTVRQLGYISGKLAFVGPHLKLLSKEKTGGFALWVGCMNGDKKSWAEMRKYNMRDTEILELLYNSLKPYIKSHPALGSGCPVCQGTRLQQRGFRRTTVSKIARLQCQDCGSWSSGKRLAA
jgi:hypothetical protein